jgi:hypothetical protein
MRVGNLESCKVLKNIWNRELGAGCQETEAWEHVIYPQPLDPSAPRPLV